MDRLAGAPISWGVCEVPGWGVELPPDRVLSEMRELGLPATELGSDGYLPTDPDALRSFVTDTHGLKMIGGFVPVVVHEPAQQAATIEATHRAAALMSGAGGTLFISAAVTTWDWDPREPVSDDGWRHAAHMFATIDEVIAEYGMVQALHPHLGTIVETDDDVQRVLDASDVGWTLDIGHLAIGGTDPLRFIDDAFSRIRHVHLKDVDLALAVPVFAGDQSIMQGVQAGMFTNLGQGDVAVAESIQALETLGYDQWYVLEQDAAITGPMPEIGSGPILDVRTSIEFLRSVDASLRAPHESEAAGTGMEPRK
jgi:inosose dehydratase